MFNDVPREGRCERGDGILLTRAAHKEMEPFLFPRVVKPWSQLLTLLLHTFGEFLC